MLILALHCLYQPGSVRLYKPLCKQLSQQCTDGNSRHAILLSRHWNMVQKTARQLIINTMNIQLSDAIVCLVFQQVFIEPSYPTIIDQTLFLNILLFFLKFSHNVFWSHSPPPQLLPVPPLPPYPLNFVFSLITNTNNEVQFVLGCGAVCWSLVDLPGPHP